MHASEAPIDAHHPATDDEVIRRVRAGEVRLFEILMRRHNERVYRAARAVLGNEADVEEVMQDAYVRAFASLSKFEGRSKFSTWMTRIVINVARSRLRGVRPVDVTGDGMKDAISDLRDPERAAAAKELAELIERSADDLPEALRSVFVLRDVQGASTKEVAEMLDLTDEAVRVRLHRARKELREALRGVLENATLEAFRFYAPRCNRVVEDVLSRLVH